MSGSSFSTLGPYWRDSLGGKEDLNARQCSSRGGDAKMHVCKKFVIVTAAACVVMSGTILY